ncbi:BnaC07g15710D [Brassica napus]|uniref:BnaC07g15710D protein n=1 Tax=Brassica napus TaxID=3708 RepID=A0A078FIQ5_BRANA|nr:BnaC07g15710D [Brassica napus]
MISRMMAEEYDDTRDAEIDELLKKLNKPALKSIKSPDGDIIDCVHMKNHPIYDNPLFKNHTIQMRPSSYPKGWNKEASKNQNHSMVMQLWTINGKCPKNSIPIIRTRRKNILQAESVERYGRKDPNSLPQPKPTNPPSNTTNEYAIVTVNSPQGKFHGAQADINVWKPKYGLWVALFLAATPLKLVGRCSRDFMVMTSLDFLFIGLLMNTKRQAATILDVQDPRTGNWWLRLGYYQILGYWPSSLFSNLKNGASEIHWGGEITNYKEDSQHTSTNMGSGRFGYEGYKKASYFMNLEIEEDGVTKPPESLTPFVTNQNCYNVIRNPFHPQLGASFYYGGPGQNAMCK